MQNLNPRSYQKFSRFCKQKTSKTYLYCFRTFSSNSEEHSRTFQTLVKLVDAEDRANDKIRTYDLTFEINSITMHLQSQNFGTQQFERLIFTQPRDSNNR